MTGRGRKAPAQPVSTREKHVLTAKDAGTSGQISRIQDWCAVNGIDANHVYRVEMFARRGELIARVYEFDRTEQGERLIRQEDDYEPATREPYTVTVRSSIPGAVAKVIPDGEDLPEPVA